MIENPAKKPRRSNVARLSLSFTASTVERLEIAMKPYRQSRSEFVEEMVLDRVREIEAVMANPDSYEARYIALLQEQSKGM